MYHMTNYFLTFCSVWIENLMHETHEIKQKTRCIFSGKQDAKSAICAPRPVSSWMCWLDTGRDGRVQRWPTPGVLPRRFLCVAQDQDLNKEKLVQTADSHFPALLDTSLRFQSGHLQGSTDLETDSQPFGRTRCVLKGNIACDGFSNFTLLTQNKIFSCQDDWTQEPVNGDKKTM